MGRAPGAVGYIARLTQLKHLYFDSSATKHYIMVSNYWHIKVSVDKRLVTIWHTIFYTNFQPLFNQFSSADIHSYNEINNIYEWKIKQMWKVFAKSALT